MARGRMANDGDTRVAPNGYHYTKQDGKWRLTHHIKMEEYLGRKLREDERVHFKSKNKLDFSRDNIELVERGQGSLRRRLAQLEARRDEITAEIDSIRSELQAGRVTHRSQ